ncbi:MAG: hypothetical protein L6R36_002550 [Xanthoria steineri]|nr:MAG: hypothetical protein L6R36_002550 [Xanthoria steineri]
MAPLSPKEAQEVFDNARRDSRSQLGAQMALMDDIEVELRRRGRSTLPEDIMTELRNAEAREQYLLNLRDCLDDKMDIAVKLGETVTQAFEESVVDLEVLQKALQNRSVRSQQVMDLIQKIIIDHPLEANEVLPEENLNAAFRDATKETLSDLSERVEDFYTELGSKFEEIHGQIRQEFRFDEFKQTFDDCVKKARYVSQAAEARLAKAENDLDATKQDLAEKGQTIETLTAKLATTTARIDALEKDVSKADEAARSERNTRETVVRHLTSQLITKDAQIANLDGRLEIVDRDLTAERRKVYDKDSVIVDLNAAAVEARTSSKDRLDRKDTKIRELEAELQQAKSDLLAERQRRDKDMRSKNEIITELKVAEAEARSRFMEQLASRDEKIQDLEEKLLQADSKLTPQRQKRDEEIQSMNDKVQELEMAMETMGKNASSEQEKYTKKATNLERALEIKRKDLDNKGKVVEAREVNIRKLSEEIKDVREAANITRQSLESAQAHLRSAIHAMMSLAAGEYIAVQDVTDGFVNSTTRQFSAADIKLDIKLPSLLLAKPATSVLLPGIRFWASAQLQRENAVLEQAQALFDMAAHTALPSGWFESAIGHVAQSLKGWRNRLDPSTLAKLCLVAMQGMVLQRAMADRPRKIQDWLQAYFKDTPSSCLRFMTGQLEAYCTAPAAPEMQWLSDYRGSGNNHLDTTDAMLPMGTSVIADESGLFFLVTADGTSVFTLEDVEEVVFDLEDGITLTVSFKASSTVQDSLVLRAATMDSRATAFALKHMRSKMRHVLSMKRGAR